MGKIFGSTKQKKKNVRETNNDSPATHTFTKNFEILTLSLKEALKNQLEVNNNKKEELQNLNNLFDKEVSQRRKAEEEATELQNKLAILQNQVKGLELQYELELNAE